MDRKRRSAKCLRLSGDSDGEEDETRGSDSKGKEAKPETLESDICDDDHASLDRPRFQALEERSGSAAKGVEWLLHGEDCFTGALREPCPMFRFADADEVTATIELARLADGGLYPSSCACHEHDDTRRRAI
jgi:hypothetical protein